MTAAWRLWIGTGKGFKRGTKHKLVTSVVVHSCAANHSECASRGKAADCYRRTWPRWRMGTARHIQLRPIAGRRVHADQGLARNRGRCCSHVPPRRQRMGHGPSLQEALHSVRQARVHGGRRTAMDVLAGRHPDWRGVRPSTSCSGPPRIESSAGFWSPPTATLSVVGMSNRSAPPSDYSFRYEIAWRRAARTSRSLPQALVGPRRRTNFGPSSNGRISEPRTNQALRE